MRDLNYQLKQLRRRNRDGSYATQAKRMHHLMLISDQLYDLGFRGMTPHSLKQKHIDALVKDWLRRELLMEPLKTGWRAALVLSWSSESLRPCLPGKLLDDVCVSWHHHCADISRCPSEGHRSTRKTIDAVRCRR